MSTVARQLDTTELEQRVKRMYEEVALEPEREFHFETGRPLAERLGYPPADLDRIPAAAIDSFAGVGHFLDLANIAPASTTPSSGRLHRGAPVEAASVDCVISNGVINLSPDKAAVFAAAGLQIAEWRENEQYRFMSERADNACANTASRVSRCSRGVLRGGVDGRQCESG